MRRRATIPIDGSTRDLCREGGSELGDPIDVLTLGKGAGVSLGAVARLTNGLFAAIPGGRLVCTPATRVQLVTSDPRSWSFRVRAADPKAPSAGEATCFVKELESLGVLTVRVEP